MSRCAFETDADKANERNMFALLEKVFQWKIQKNPLSYQIDGTIFHEDSPTVRAIGFVEIKCHRFPSFSGVFVKISLRKIRACKSFGRMFKLPSFVVIRWPDMKWGILDITNRDVENDRIEWGGRTVSGRDNQDQEPMMCFPKDEFTVHDVSDEDAWIYGEKGVVQYEPNIV